MIIKSNVYELMDLFGTSPDDMDKILIEHGLMSSNNLPTQKAMDDGFVHIFLLKSSNPYYHWNAIKISELTGRKLLDEIGFHVREVMNCIHTDDLYYPDRDIAMIAAARACKHVPNALWVEVQKRVEQAVTGDHRYACVKCGRMTFWGAETGYCWRCIPNDPFAKERLAYEAAACEAAAQLAADGWSTFYADNDLKPMDTDIDLWNGAINNAIDSLLSYSINPCDKDDTRSLIDRHVKSRALANFVYTGYEHHGWQRCAKFLRLAYYTVASVLMKGST